MIVKHMHQNLLNLEMTTGPDKGKRVVLPRITLQKEMFNEGCFLQRRQFPIALAHCLTIDKSQGQSLENVGLHLFKDCFAHGQLHTGLGRAMNPLAVGVHLGLKKGATKCRTKTKNAVWQEII